LESECTHGQLGIIPFLIVNLEEPSCCHRGGASLNFSPTDSYVLQKAIAMTSIPAEPVQGVDQDGLKMPVGVLQP